MVRHIVSWNFKGELSDKEKKETALKIKTDLEALAEIIEGVKELKVSIDLLPASNKDIFLTSLFESEEALGAYQVHPEHKKAGEFIRSATKERVCIDYFE